MYTVESPPCSEAELRAARAASKMYSDLGFSSSVPEGDTSLTISELSGALVQLTDAMGSEDLSFRWHSSLDGVFETGEEVQATRTGPWSILRGARQTAILFSSNLTEDFASSSAPDEGPRVYHLAQCTTAKESMLECGEKPDLIVLQAISTIDGTSASIGLGETIQLSGWSVTHFDGRWLPNKQKFRAVTAYLSPAP